MDIARLHDKLCQESQQDKVSASHEGQRKRQHRERIQSKFGAPTQELSRRGNSYQD